ncbi:MAG: hypothetical protein A2Z99_11010 [Treponema sp. GWB1_62_6]|nr:MAG: hypothetical protein A2Z99_11010 [Treponema sp. GWB1_62_6]
MPYNPQDRQKFLEMIQRIPDSPVKQDLINQMMRQYDLQNPQLEENFDKYINADIQDLPEYGWLLQYLKGGAEKGMPYKADLLQTATGTIRGQYDTASRNLSDRLSSRGLGSSGVGLVAQNQLQGQESGAINQATAGINAQDIDYRQNAIAQLLGLSQAQAGYGLNQKGQSLGALEYLYGSKQQANEFMLDYNQKQRQAEMQFWSSLLGSAGQAAGAGFAGGGGGGGGGYPAGSYNYGGSNASGYA